MLNILEVDFIDEYIKVCKPKYHITMWGANKVPELGRILTSMFKCGILTRSRIKVNAGWEFPSSVYVYELSEDWR